MNPKRDPLRGPSRDQFLASSEQDIGTLLLGIRRVRGLTQAELAARAGVLPKTVSAIENSTGRVLVGTLMRCISALEIDLIVAPREPELKTSPRRPRTVKAPIDKILKERW